jgi:predicted DNA-binding transcriptional regulator YafY
VTDNEIKRQLKGMIKDGFSVAEIANDFGVSRTTIYNWLRAYGLSYPRSKTTPTIDEDRLKSYMKLLKKKRGMGIAKLVYLLEVSKETIYRDFRRLADMGICIERVGMTRPTRYRIVE